MTTPTENPTCKRCGQKRSEHHLANYADGSPITMNTLVCPFATFEAETNLSGGVEGNAGWEGTSTDRTPSVDKANQPSESQSSENQASPAQSLSPAQEKLCAKWASDDGKWTTQDHVELNLRQFLREALAVREPAPQPSDLTLPEQARMFTELGEQIEQLERDNADLRSKLEELQGWKDSMIAVDSKCDWQEIGRELGLTLGTDVRASILPKIRELKQQRAWVPIATPPTEADADDDGFVRWLFADGTRSHRHWDKNWKDHNYSPPTHWHSLPKLQQPDPDADEAEFVKLFGPMEITSGYGWAMYNYKIRQAEKLKVWKAARQQKA